MLGGTNNYLFFMSLAGFPVVLFLIFMLKWTNLFFPKKRAQRKRTLGISSKKLS